MESNQAAVSVGKRLKEAREKKSLTIEQIQKQTKIHSTVLIALEEGRASDILTDTYVRSFLKKYMQVLGLPPGELLKEYFPPHPQAAALNIPAHENPMPEETRMGPKVLYFTGMAVLGISALLVILMIGGKVVTVFNKALSAHKGAPVTATARKKAVKAAESVKKKSPLTSSGQSREAKKTAAKIGAESKDAISKSTPLSLVIKVREQVLVKLTKDGVLMFTHVLPKGLVETITANESIELEIGKAQALKLILNGRPLALPANNNILRVAITRKSVKFK